ncbi:MAG: putative lipid II flippase FtsW, partial [Tumebacillaceae bacterium]
MKLTRHRPDFVLFFVVIVLVFFGLVNIYSASTIIALQSEKNTAYFFIRQLIWVFLGLFVMLFTMNIPFQRWMKLSKLFLLGSFIMLPMAFLFEGVNGAHRWINLKVVSFQPSELAMLSIILYVSFLLSKKQDRILDPKASFWPSMVLIGYGAAVILVEPDMGTAVIFATAPFVVMCTSGIPKKYIRNTIIVGIAACVPLALMDYRGDRMSTYMNPWAHQDSLGLQTVQSLYAISNGGWFGRGLGHSIEKFSYLPEPHTDFIFAIISEEWGFVGAVFLIGLFAVLIWRGIHIATHVPNRFAGLTAVGITTNIAMLAFINIGSVSSLLPVIGVPLPFISYGGTTLLVKMFSMGILLNISRYTTKEMSSMADKEAHGLKTGATIPLSGSRFD